MIEHAPDAVAVGRDRAIDFAEPSLDPSPLVVPVFAHNGEGGNTMTVRFGAILALPVVLTMMVAAQTTRTPTPAPGVTHVIVDGVPIAAVRQEGPWSIASTHSSPAVAGRRYAFTWPDGERDVHTVTGTRNDGWVQVDGAARWLNTAVARSMEEEK
jgi:hypothetical protein